MENLVIIEYVGKSYGTQSFYGISTGSRYSAGLTRPRVAVDKNDLLGKKNRLGLLELVENGRNIFRLVPAPVQVKVTTQPEIDIVEVEVIETVEEETPVVVKKERKKKEKRNESNNA
jgi:hypothetical protein